MGTPASGTAQARARTRPSPPRRPASGCGCCGCWPSWWCSAWSRSPGRDRSTSLPRSPRQAVHEQDREHARRCCCSWSSTSWSAGSAAAEDARRPCGRSRADAVDAVPDRDDRPGPRGLPGGLPLLPQPQELGRLPHAPRRHAPALGPLAVLRPQPGGAPARPAGPGRRGPAADRPVRVLLDAGDRRAGRRAGLHADRAVGVRLRRRRDVGLDPRRRVLLPDPLAWGPSTRRPRSSPGSPAPRSSRRRPPTSSSATTCSPTPRPTTRSPRSRRSRACTAR